MADNKTYPVIPVSHWWKLRKQFVKSIPSKVTPGYLAAILNMKERSAKSNVIPSLIICGIIDADGNPLERATQWRDDQQYSNVCEEIRKEVYPQELLDAFPGPSPDREAVKRWFAVDTGTGEVNVKRFTTVFMMLAEADPSKALLPSSSEKAASPKKPPRKQPNKKTTLSKKEVPQASISGLQPPTLSSSMSPSLHVDIQIHIAPDATAEQIDQIFASMAKHLYRHNDE